MQYLKNKVAGIFKKTSSSTSKNSLDVSETSSLTSKISITTSKTPSTTSIASLTISKIPSITPEISPTTSKTSLSTSKKISVLRKKKIISEHHLDATIDRNKSVRSLHDNTGRAIIIWFEPTFFVRDDFQQIFHRLDGEYQNADVFTDIHKCLDSLTNIASDSKVHLLMPGMWAADLLNYLENSPTWKMTTNKVFIYSSSPEQYEFLCEQNSQIKRIYASVEDIWNGIHQYINKRCEVLRFYDQRTVRELSCNETIAEFIWFMVFKDALFQMPHDKKGKNDMVDVCQRFYANNDAQLAMIKDFISSYESEDAPEWFSRSCFLYKLINRALRTQDVEQLYVFRYYIQDLSSWLSREFHKIAKCKEKFFLYRGAALSQNDFQRLDSQKLLAPNGFFSTSRDINVAKCFIGSSRSDTVRVLYKIKCDMASYTYDEIQKLVAFADISENSYIPDEKEVLFDLGATFEIENIESQSKENDYITIHMTPSCEGGHIWQEYREQCQNEIENSSAAVTFGVLLFKTGKYMTAQHYFEQLLNNPNGENISDIYHYLGWTHMRQDKYGQAITYFERAHELIPKSDNCSRAQILSSIGKALVEKDFINESLSYYQKALDLQIARPGLKKEDVANSYINVGRLHNVAGNYILARQYYTESLRTDTSSANSVYSSNCTEAAEEINSMIYSTSGSHSFNKTQCSSNYERISSSLYELGSIQWEMGEPASGLLHMKRSLSIDKHSFAHRTLWPYRRFHAFSNVPPLDEPHKKEINYRLYCLDNIRQRSRKTDNEEAKALEKVGAAYAAVEQFDDALEYYLSALQQREKQGRKSKYSPDVARTLNYVGDMYHSLYQFQQALNFYERALAIYKKCPLTVSLDRLRTRNKIDKITQKMSSKHKASTTTKVSRVQTGLARVLERI